MSHTHFHTRTPKQHNELNTERQTDRQTETERQKETERRRRRQTHTERQADRSQREREIGDTRDNSLSTMVTDKHVCFLYPALAQTRDYSRSRYTYTQTDRSEIQTDGQTERSQADRKTDRERRKSTRYNGS